MPSEATKARSAFIITKPVSFYALYQARLTILQTNPCSSINNDKTGAYEGVYLNRFFSGVYTPGSTFKMITSICAIENLPDIDSQKFKCTGEYKVGGNTVKCLGVHGTMNSKRLSMCPVTAHLRRLR